jgi:alcohol dehydrogenase
MITAQLYSPSVIIMIDMDHNRLKVATTLGAHHTIDPSEPDAVEKVSL